MSTMCPKHQQHFGFRQTGFSIVSAIFLIVVMALLAVSMTRLLSTGTQSVSQEITSLKAYTAARSGLQWGMYQSVYGAPVVENINFNNSGLENTSAGVTLVNTPILGRNYFIVSSIGEYGSAGPPPDTEYSQRRLELKFNP